MPEATGPRPGRLWHPVLMASNPTRQLVLLRHAKSAWLDVPDHDRPLAKRGLRDAPGAGRWLRQAGYVPDLVVCSTARRTSETWELAAAELGASPPVRFERRGDEGTHRPPPQMGVGGPGHPPSRADGGAQP